jgi:hypothetical protein
LENDRVKGAQKVRIHFKGAMNLAVAEFRMEGMVTGFHEQTLSLSFVDHWTTIMLSLQGCQIEPLPPVPLPGHGRIGRTVSTILTQTPVTPQGLEAIGQPSENQLR